MKHAFLLATLLLLAACGDNFKQDVNTASNNFRNSVAGVNRGLHDYFNPKPKPKPQPHEMPPSYCYKLLTDVVCYDTPQAGMENKLVAKQVPAAVSDKAMTGGDPNVGVIDMQPVASPPPPMTSAPVPPVSSAQPGTTSSGNAPQQLMPQF